MALKKICFIAADSFPAQSALLTLTANYGNVSLAEADVVIPLGGDGHLLTSLHNLFSKNEGRLPEIFGMNRGRLGFLMNEFQSEGLHERIEHARRIALTPLKMDVLKLDGSKHSGSFFRALVFFRVCVC